MTKPYLHYDADSLRRRRSALEHRRRYFEKLEAARKAQGEPLTQEESQEYSVALTQLHAVSEELLHKHHGEKHLGWTRRYWELYDQFCDELWKSKGKNEKVTSNQAHFKALEVVAAEAQVNVKTVREAVLHQKGYNPKKLERDWHPSDDQEPEEPTSL